MRNAKKTLSLVMIAIFTTFIVLSGIPAGAVTAAQAKAQVSKATAAVVKVEKTVKVASFNVTTALAQYTAAGKEVAKVKGLGKSYAKTYTSIYARLTAVSKKIAARKAAIAKAEAALKKAFADADKAVEALERAVDPDNVDLVGDAAALGEAQGAVTSALEYIEKLDKDSASYKGLMARVDIANGLVVKAMEEIAANEAAAAKEAEEKAAKEAAEKLEKEAQAAAETAVKAVEDAVAANDLVKAAAAATEAIAKVNAVTNAEAKTAFEARLKVAYDKTQPAVVKSVTAVDTKITVIFDKKPLTTPAAADFVVTKAVGLTTDTVTPAATTVAPSLVKVVDDKTVELTVATVDPTSKEQKVTYTVTYKTGTATVAAYTIPAVPALAATATATNMKEIVVVFNQKVDATTAETAGNYSIPGTPVLQEDEKTVILTVTTPLVVNSTNTLAITNVKSAVTGLYPAVSATFVAMDSTIPVAVSAAVTGPTTLSVTFSEPVVVGGTFTLDNNTYSVGAPAAGSKTNVITLTIPSVLTAGAHTLAVSNVVDYSGLKIASATLSFNYAADTTAPTVALSDVTQNSLKLTFSKPITNGQTLTVYHTYNGVAGYAGTVASFDGTTAVVTFASNYLPLGTATVYVNNASTTTAMKDAWGNSFVNATLTTPVVADTVAPVVSSAVYTAASKSIAVTFSKAVETTSATTAANYTLKNSAGTVVPFTVTYASNVATLTITGPALAPDTYTLTVANVKAANVAATTMTAYATSFSVADLSLPVISAATYSADFTKLYVAFSKPVATTGTYSVLDLNKYNVLFDGSTVTELSSIAGTTIAADSTKSVVITFPSARTYSGTPVVNVSRIVDASGIYSAVALNSNITSANIAVANVDDVRVIAKNKVSFVVNSNLTSINANMFMFGSTTASAASYVNSGTTATVTLTGPADSFSANATTTTTAITVKANAMTNSKGYTVASNFTLPTAADYVAPSIASRVVTAAGIVVVTFDEALYAASVAYDSFVVAGQTITNVALDGTGKVVTLTLANTLTTGAAVSVQLVKPVMDASAQHNVLSAETVGTSVTVTP